MKSTKTININKKSLLLRFLQSTIYWEYEPDNILETFFAVLVCVALFPAFYLVHIWNALCGWIGVDKNCRISLGELTGMIILLGNLIFVLALSIDALEDGFIDLNFQGILVINLGLFVGILVCTRIVGWCKWLLSIKMNWK